MMQQLIPGVTIGFVKPPDPGRGKQSGNRTAIL